MIDLKSATQWLIENAYVVEHQGKLKFTAKFYKDFKNLDGGIVITNDRRIAVQQPITSAPDWSQLYLNFIKTANIPSTARLANGGVYDLNKYSEDGMKAFKKAVESGVNLQILIRSTALYYNADKDSLKQKVGNYMADGTWRSGYEDMLKSLNDGNLVDYVKSKTKDNNGSFRLR